MENMYIKAKRSGAFKRNIAGWLFASPVIIGLLALCFWPIIQSFFLSFMKGDMISGFEWCGLENYKRIFTVPREARMMAKIVKNTILYTVITVPLNMLLSFSVALLLNKKLKGIYGFRLLYYLPVMIPSVASSILWRDMFEPTYGILNQILSMLGLPKSNFIYGSDSAMASIIFTNFFGVGGGMILWLASFKNIPSTLYESANLDGAKWYTKLFKITIPLCTPIIFYNLITSIIGTLQIFHVYMMNGIGPDGSLYFYAVKIYEESFLRPGKMGYASALAWLLFLAIAILTFVGFKTSKWVYYAED